MLGIPRHIGHGTAPTFAKRRQEMIDRITLNHHLSPLSHSRSLHREQWTMHRSRTVKQQ
jgi:hypothetical protein